MRFSWSLCVWLLGLAAAASAAAGPLSPPPAGGKRFALLVGCTRYPSLTLNFQLRGPANDVVMMRQLLTSRFGFDQGQIVILSEEQDADHRPTRAHIEREFRRLAERAQRGDQVVILMSGHGSQQPDQDPPDPNDPEPDGLDEIFLPSDIGEWDGSKGSLPNAIIDDELSLWLEKITAKGASVWIIMDACHSGTMTRGLDDDVRSRQVPAGVLVPQEALDRARKRAEGLPRSRGVGPDGAPMDASQAPGGRLVAIYASQSTEETIEKSLPLDAEQPRPYGVLTYALCEVLTQAATPVTYAELVQRVQQQYLHWSVQMGRSMPTPLLEGPDRDREVLGTEQFPDRSRIVLHSQSGRWTVNAGSLLGLTEGSVLRVLPRAGEKDADKPIGHVKVTALRALDADVEPCAFANMPAAKLPEGGRCQMAYRRFATRRIRVAIDQAPTGDAVSRSVALAELKPQLQKLAQGDGSMVEWSDHPSRADWVVRVKEGKAYLVSAAQYDAIDEVSRGGSRGKSATALFGPAPADSALVDWLDQRLRRIAIVQSLLALGAPEGGQPVDATSSRTADEGTVDVHVDVLRFRSRSDREGQVVQWQKDGLTFRPGEIVGFRVENRCRDSAVDVTLLFVDSGYGIEPFFPTPNTIGDNRWKPGEKRLARRAVVSSTTVGIEHMVVIAVRAEPNKPPFDFSPLAQPTIETEHTRGINDPGELPLGRLMKSVLHGHGTTRGFVSEEVDTYAMRVVSWQVQPTTAK